MTPVEHDGNRYLLRKQSTESSLVYDPETGDERYLPTDELTEVGDSPLSVAAESVPEAARRVLVAVHSDETLGLLVELDERGPLPARELLGRYGLCESDLHGRTAELRAAGLVATADIDGERGYAITDAGRDGLDVLR